MECDPADSGCRLHFGCGEKKGLLKEKGCRRGGKRTCLFPAPYSRFCMEPTT